MYMVVIMAAWGAGRSSSLTQLQGSCWHMNTERCPHTCLISQVNGEETGETLSAYSSSPETVFGAAYLAILPSHRLLHGSSSVRSALEKGFEPGRGELKRHTRLGYSGVRFLHLHLSAWKGSWKQFLILFIVCAFCIEQCLINWSATESNRSSCEGGPTCVLYCRLVLYLST